MRNRLTLAAVLAVAFCSLPALGQTATPTVTPTPTPTVTPTLTPTPTPTPLTVSANSTYTLCSITSGAGTCGKIRKAASQATTAAYLFQMSAASGTGAFVIGVSCDDATFGTTSTFKARLTRHGESYSLPVADVGPCTIVVTPQWGGGTITLYAAISGDHTMLALPTPAP